MPPSFSAVWVDPVHGDDGNSGSTRDLALRSLKEAWARIPAQTHLTMNGYRILLTAGDYASDLLPDNGWMSDRNGTASCPILIESVDGPLAARLHGHLDAQNDTYLYLVGLDFVTDPGGGGGGDVVHLASDDHVLIRDCKLDGFDGSTRQTQETLKANQCQHLYVEDSEIAGAYWFPVDFVSVQYGHILGCRVHDAGDDGLVLKGGTDEILVQGNEIYDIATVGIAAGQGTGLEYMVAPWIQYEVYNVQIVGNYVHDVQNAGLAVRGGTDVTVAGNMFYRVGLNQDMGSAMLLIGLGSRGCDGDAAACRALQALGGWGPTQPGEAGEWIPNQNVSITGNVFLNPAGAATLYDTITIVGPAFPPPGTNIPSPARADSGLTISGNNFWNGGPGHNLGVEDPVLATAILENNQIGTVQPPLNPPPIGIGGTPLPPVIPLPPVATPPANPTPPSPMPTSPRAKSIPKKPALKHVLQRKKPSHRPVAQGPPAEASEPPAAVAGQASPRKNQENCHSIASSSGQGADRTSSSVVASP